MCWRLLLACLSVHNLIAGGTDLALSLSAASSSVEEGSSISITLTLDNLSAVQADEVSLQCDIPLGFSVSDISDDGSYDAQERAIAWPTFSLNGSAQIQRTFQATANLPDNGMPLFFVAFDTNSQSQQVFLIEDHMASQATDPLPGLIDPTGTAQDGAGNLFILDAGNADLFDGSNQPINDGQLRRLDPDGLTLVASGELLTNPRRILLLPDGNFMVADPDAARTDGMGDPSDDQSGRLVLIDPSTGVQILFFEGDPLVHPMDLTLDDEGNLWVVDLSGKLVRFAYPDATPSVQLAGDPAFLPTCIEFHPNHGLIFGDGVSGLVQVDPLDLSHNLLTPIGGAPFELIDPQDVAFLLGGELWVFSAGNDPNPLFIEIAPDTGEGIREISSNPGLQYTDPSSLFGSPFFHTNAGVTTVTVDVDNTNNGASLYTRLEINPTPATVVVNVQETVTLGDQVTAVPAVQVAVSEQVGTNDSIVANPAVLVAVQEAISTGDQITANPALQVMVTETIASFDQLTPTLQSGGPSMVRSFVPQDQIPLGETQIRFTPTQIYLQFSELMNDPDGDVDENDVTNPIHYTLVRSEDEPNLGECGLPGAGDTLVEIDHVVFYDSIQSAVLNFPDGLRPGNYRLLVCGETGLQDLEGIAFDGDGDNQPGGNYVADFSVTANNLLYNPHFDFEPKRWNPEGGTVQFVWFVDDANNLVGSRSVGLRDTSPETEGVFGQCISVTGDTWYKFATKFRNQSQSDAPFPLVIRVEWYSGDNCFGEAFDAFETTSIFTNTFDEWLPFSQMVHAPANAVWARVLFGFQPGAQLEQYIQFDDMQFVEDPAAIFSDGFESGDLSNWQRQ